VPGLAEFGSSLDGVLPSPDPPGCEAIRRPVSRACREVGPRLVVLCRRATAHAGGSGRVYPDFPDPAPDNWASAYHAGNYPRLAAVKAVKNACDPYRFSDFPQAI